MKKQILFLISFLLLQMSLIAQNTLTDTVKIKPVSVKSTVFSEKLHQLDSSDLSNPQHLNLGDLLAKKSHLFIKSYGIGSLSTISLRGSGSSHTQLYWNGISINSSMNGSSDLSLFPLFFMDNVTLNYGLKSIVDGAGGIGGAVNFNSQASFKKQQQLEVSSTFGSFGQRQYAGRLTTGTNKVQSVTKLYFNEAENNFTYKDLTQEGFPNRKVNNASFEQKGLLQSLYYRPKETQLLEGQLWLFDSKRNLPPLITLREHTEFQNDISLKAIIGFNKYWDNSKLSVKSSFLNDVLKYQNERASIDSKSETKSYRSRVDYEIDFSEKVMLAFQSKFDLNQAESQSYSGNLQEERLSFLGQFQYVPNQKIKIQFSSRELIILGQENFFVPQLKVEVQPFQSKSFHLQANGGMNVKYPNLNDLYFVPSGNLNLKAETSNGLEVGTSLQNKLLGNKLRHRSQITFFYSNIENYIQWVPTAFGYWKPDNLKEVETKGIEVNTEWEHLEAKVSKVLVLNYSYTSSINYEKEHEFDESNGKQLIYIPLHKGNIAFNSSYKTYSISINQQFIGERFISSDNEERLPSYQLLDISIAKLLVFQSNQVSLTFGVKNLLNAEYQAIEWRPMPNRNYFIKLNYQFTK